MQFFWDTTEGNEPGDRHPGVLIADPAPAPDLGKSVELTDAG